MIAYNKSEAFITSFDPAQGIIVIEVNCQGLCELTKHQEAFKELFPETYKEYIKLVVERMITPGETLWFKEDMFNIALMVTQCNMIGSNKDTDFEVQAYTDAAVEELISLSDNDIMLCPLINKGPYHKHFIAAVAKFGRQLDWHVYVR